MATLHPGSVVSRIGPGGIGKTALASEAVWRLAAEEELATRFPDGVLFHSFYRQPQSDIAFQYIATQFKEPIESIPIAAAKAALSGRTALLILDGTEAADNLGDVLAIRGRCGVLLTSRSHRDPVADYEDVTPLPLDDAVALLHAWGNDRVNDGEAARRICELVGELPLAVRLAGSALREEGIYASEYLSEFLEQTPLASLDRGNRQRNSVPLLLERSVSGLSEAGQDALSVVGLLTFAPFSAEMMAAALDLSPQATLNALGELVKYSLLTRPDQSYEVTHRLLHTYARRRLEPTPEARQRLVAYLTEFVDANEGNFARFENVRLHILNLVDLCLQAQAWEEVDVLVSTIDGYLDLRGYYVDRLTTNKAGLIAARESQNRQREGNRLVKLGATYRNLGRADRSIEPYQQALIIAREIGDRGGEGAALIELGNAYTNLKQVEEAIEYLRQALTIAREIGDWRGESVILGALGLNSGQAEEAIEYLQQALTIAREIGDRRNESIWLSNLGNAYRNLERMEEAVESCQQALAIARELGDRRGEGAALGNLGLAYYSLGRLEEAIDHHQQALAIAREIGDRRNEGNDLGNLGVAYADLGRLKEAVDYYQKALVIFEEIRSSNAKSVRQQLEKIQNK